MTRQQAVYTKPYSPPTRYFVLVYQCQCRRRNYKWVMLVSLKIYFLSSKWKEGPFYPSVNYFTCWRFPSAIWRIVMPFYSLAYVCVCENHYENVGRREGVRGEKRKCDIIYIIIIDINYGSSTSPLNIWVAFLMNHEGLVALKVTFTKMF